MAAPRPPPEPTEFPATDTLTEQAAFLLEYAILAPSSHNSQPWAFEITDHSIEVSADESRHLEVADPDGRELLLSVGCALANLVIAAERFGLGPTVDYCPGGRTRSPSADDLRHVATVDLDGPDGTRSADSELFEAIPARHTNHQRFDSRPVPDAVLDRLRAEAETGGCGLELVTDVARREAIAALQTRADERLFDDPAYRAELAHSIGTGALGANWLTARLGRLVVRYFDLGDREGRKNAERLRSAPVVAVLTAESDAVETQLRTGVTFERMALHATAAGLAVHPMSQILEVPETREELAERLDLDDAVPIHLCRLGYADPDPTSTPRRPVEAVRVDR